jgi:hypothetical protein
MRPRGRRGRRSRTQRSCCASGYFGLSRTASLAGPRATRTSPISRSCRREGVVKHGLVRREANGVAHGVGRELRAPELVVDDRELVVGRGAVGIEPRGGLQRLDGLLHRARGGARHPDAPRAGGGPRGGVAWPRETTVTASTWVSRACSARATPAWPSQRSGSMRTISRNDFSASAWAPRSAWRLARAIHASRWSAYIAVVRRHALMASSGRSIACRALP